MCCPIHWRILMWSHEALRCPVTGCHTFIPREDIEKMTGR